MVYSSVCVLQFIVYIAAVERQQYYICLKLFSLMIYMQTEWICIM
jgi:hypothetical protein